MSDLSNSDVPTKKRRRPPLSCEQCRKKKIRCDRTLPCNNCKKSRDSHCTYASGHKPQPPSRKQQSSLPSTEASARSPPRVVFPASQQDRSSFSEFHRPCSLPTPLRDFPSTQPSTPSLSASASASNVDWLVARVNQLEKQLAENVHLNDVRQNSIHSSPLSVDTTVHVKGSVSKTRYFGESHWMNGASLFPLELKLLGQAELDQGELYLLLNKTKMIGRKLKESRVNSLSSTSIGKSFPSKELADQLIENYLRTFEGVLRIVHIPTFRADYARYWQNQSAASESLVILLQLCMALGSSIRDDSYSIKSTATQWIYEAEIWMILPPEKSRMTILGIQIMCLLAWAKTVIGVGPDLVWVHAGGLVRRAMYMGLHRDPMYLGEMTKYRAEMRRRLWATILELNLQLSYEAGGLPLISALEYDTKPPGNINDDQLSDETDIPRSNTDESSEKEETQMTLQIALLKSLPLRQRLLEAVNNFRSKQSYDDILQLNSEMTKACREFSQATTRSGGSSGQWITHFHITVAELMMYRCFNTLHIPILSKSFVDPKTYFSRKMCLDNALKIAHMWGFTGTEAPLAQTSPDFKRLTITGSGMFRNVIVQAFFVLCLELLHEHESKTTGLGYLPGPHRSQIRHIVEGFLAWCIGRMRAGETSPKGHCFVSACLGFIEALDKELGKDGTEALIIQRATESAALSLELLKEIARNDGVHVDGDSDEGIPAMKDGMADLGMDWQSTWAWEDADGLPSWWQLQMPIPGDDLNKFFAEPCNNDRLCDGDKRVCGGRKVQEPGESQGCAYRQLCKGGDITPVG